MSLHCDKKIVIIYNNFNFDFLGLDFVYLKTSSPTSTQECLYQHLKLSASALTNKGRFRSKPISVFVYNYALHQSQRFDFEIISKRSKKILSHSKVSVSYNFYILFFLKPKGYIKAQIYLKFCRGTF